MSQYLQDILQEPLRLIGTLEHTLGKGRPALERAARRVASARWVMVTGIGSSWHAGMAVQALLAGAGKPVCLVDASELLHFVNFPAGAVLIVLSRSGKSVEVVKLLDKARAANVAVIAVTNTPDSPLSQQAEAVLELAAPFDHNVSVTMYSGLALVGGLLAAQAAQTLTPTLAADLKRSLEHVQSLLPPWREQLEQTPWLSADLPTYFLARGASLASGHEARLVWEEAAKTAAGAMTTGGFRHGPQEMLLHGARIGIWLDPCVLRRQDLELAADLRNRKISVMLIGQQVSSQDADLVFTLPRTPPHWQFLIDIIPTQLAAYQLARIRGADCDSFAICPYIIADEGGLSPKTVR